jgi:hypothetical protein
LANGWQGDTPGGDTGRVSQCARQDNRRESVKRIGRTRHVDDSTSARVRTLGSFGILAPHARIETNPHGNRFTMSTSNVAKGRIRLSWLVSEPSMTVWGCVEIVERCGIGTYGFHPHASFPSVGRSALVPSRGNQGRCAHPDDVWGPSGLRASEDCAEFGVVCEVFPDGTSKPSASLGTWLTLATRTRRLPARAVVEASACFSFSASVPSGNGAKRVHISRCDAHGRRGSSSRPSTRSRCDSLSRHGLVDYPQGQCSGPPRASPSALRTLRGLGQRGFTSHGVMRTDVVGRVTERAPALDAAHARDTDSSPARKGSCRGLRALLLQRFGPFGDRGDEGAHLTV